jgi:hypothetical protein
MENSEYSSLETDSPIWSALKDALIRTPSADMKPTRLWFQRLWIFAIYIVGLGVWTVFLNFGKFDWGIQDWFWAYRYGSAITTTLESGQLPLHIEPPVNYLISRYLAIPDYPLAPQFFLAGALGLGPMYLLNNLLLYSVGFLGCLLIKRRFQLSLLAFTAIAFLYSFNGYITSNLSIGHWDRAGYFYLPFFAYLIVRLFDKDRPKAWFAKMGLTLFGMLLQGSVRLFAGCILFMGVLWLLSPGVRRHLFGGILAGVALNLYRFAPASLELGQTSNIPFAGFVSLNHILRSMVQIVPPYEAEAGLPLAWWEFDVFIGIAGFILVAVFGLYLGFLKNRGTPGVRQISMRPIGYASIILFILSTNYIFQIITRSPIPLVRLFHVPSRLLIVPLMIIILLATIRFQKWLDDHPPDSMQFAFIGAGLTYLVLDLIAHARIWRVSLVNEAFDPQPYAETFQIVARDDPTYILVLAVSAMISGISLAYVIIKILRARSTEDTGIISAPSL